MKRILKVLFIISLISVLMTACTPLFTEPELLNRETGNGGMLPQVNGFTGSDKINEQLLTLFEPYADVAFNTANANDALNAEYTLEKQKSLNPFRPEYRISLVMSNQNGTSLTVASASLSGMSKLDMEQVSPSDLGWIASGDDILVSLRLNEMGVQISPAEIYGKSSYQFAVEMFVQMYEQKLGKPLDCSKIKAAEGADDFYKKALELELMGFSPDSPYYDYPSYLDIWDELQFAQKVLSRIMNDGYGVHSDNVSGEDMHDLIRIFADIINVNLGDLTDWSQLAEADLAEPVKDAGLWNKKLNRQQAAKLLCTINKNTPSFGAKLNDNYLWSVDDSDDINVRRAVTYQFMSYYGDSTIFAPEQKLSYVKALDNARSYILSKVTHLQSTRAYTLLDYNSLMISKMGVLEEVDIIKQYLDTWEQKHEKNPFEIKEVINDRDYDWFFSQNDTGTYSSVNCMPSIATMAAHWYKQSSKATVKKMRATSDVDGGWTAYELRNALKQYNVPYSVVDASLDNIIEAIDNGKIVLAQYSDRPFNMSGHCYVIYGYRQYGDTTIFIVNDSDSLSVRSALYGRPSGCGDEIDADFSIWSIQRFVSDVSVIG